MDAKLLFGFWLGAALRIGLGWLIACGRERRLLPFDERQLPSLYTVASLGAGSSFVSGWLSDPALQPAQHFLVALACGFFAQVLLRDGLKGLDKPQALAPPVAATPLVPEGTFPDHPPTGTHPMANEAWDRRQRSKEQ